MADGPPRVRRRGSGLRARLDTVTRVVFLLLMLVVAANGPASAHAAPGAPLPMVGDVCGEASRLIEQGRPSEALALIALHRQTDAAAATSGGALPSGYFPRDACGEQRELALTNVARAQAYTALAEELSKKEDASGDDAAATSTAVASVPAGCPPLDSTDELTAEGARTLARQCDRGEEPTESGLASDLGKAWASAEKTIVGPLGAVALPIALVALGLLVAARLVVPLVRRWPRIDRSGPGLLLTSGSAVLVASTCIVVGLMVGAPKGLGVLLIALTGLVLLVAGAARTLPPTLRRNSLVTSAVLSFLALIGLLTDLTRPLLLVSGLVLAGWAVVLVCVEMATRLKLSISVRDASGGEKEARVSHLVALLEEMGGGGPTGMEVPRGADVSALTSGVIATDPANAVIKAVWTAWQLLVGPIPWRIQVDEDDAGRLNVIMTRNGRAAGAVVIDPSGLLTPTAADADRSGVSAGGKDPFKLDAYRFVAAAILVRLGRFHAFPGLYNVRSGLSLGYHCVATLDLEEGDARREMLEQARAHQFTNQPTRLALQQHLYRKASADADLDVFVDWLNGFIDEVGADAVGSPLALRAHNLRATALINRFYPCAVTLGVPEAEAPQPLAEAISGFAAAVEKASATDQPRPAGDFVARMNERVRWLKAAYLREGELVLRTATPAQAYSSACYHASVTHEYDKAIKNLKVSDLDPDLLDWRPRDPQLRALHASEVYQHAYPYIPRTVLELPSLEGAREALGRYGLDTVQGLASLRGSVDDVARLLGVPLSTARRVVATAEVVASLDAAGLVSHAVEVTHELAGQGLIDLHRLGVWARRAPEVLAGSITAALEKRLDNVPDSLREDLVRWLGSL